MNEFDKVMLTLYGPDWDKKIDRNKMIRQFNANKQSFRNAVFNKQKKEAGQLLSDISGSEPELPSVTIPSISTGPIVDASHVPGANNKSRAQLAGEMMLSIMPKNNRNEKPDVRFDNIKKETIPVNTGFSELISNEELPKLQETTIIDIPDNNISEEWRNRKVKEQRERLSNDIGIITYPFNFWNYVNAVKSTYGLINDATNYAINGITNFFTEKPKHAKNTPKYNEPNNMNPRYQKFQQGGQVSQQNAQQQFVAYIAEIFGIQNEAQLKQVVSKLGKQGIAQLQKAFQQGIPAEQIRKQMQGGTQSARQGARITRTGDFVPCAKCGGKAKKKRFGDGGEVQHAGCGCSEIRKGCNGMSFMAKCGGRAKKVSKKEDGGTVPETYGRPIGGATVLPFLLKNSNKKSKRFSER